MNEMLCKSSRLYCRNLADLMYLDHIRKIYCIHTNMHMRTHKPNISKMGSSSECEIIHFEDTGFMLVAETVPYVHIGTLIRAAARISSHLSLPRFHQVPQSSWPRRCMRRNMTNPWTSTLSACVCWRWRRQSTRTQNVKTLPRSTDESQV